MPRSSYRLKLFREFVQFARENRMYWIVPMILVLGLAGIVIVAGEAVAPLIYAMF